MMSSLSLTKPSSLLDKDGSIVEKIVDMKVEGSNIMYLVKWKDRSSLSNSWEKNTSLKCQDKIDEYMKGKTKTLSVKNQSEPKIIGAYKTPVTLMFVALIDGKIQRFNNEDMKKNHINWLLSFYENNIQFTDTIEIPNVNNSSKENLTRVK